MVVTTLYPTPLHLFSPGGRTIVLLALLFLSTLLYPCSVWPLLVPTAVASAWDHWGADLTNRRWGYAETTLNVSNIGRIKAKWSFVAGSDVTATPVIVDGRLYVPDWAGNLWCLDSTTGATIWRQNISQLVYSVDAKPYPEAKPSQIISRASPAILGTIMVRL